MVLSLALVILVGEGYFVYRWYDRFYDYEVASDTVSNAHFADKPDDSMYPKTVEDTGFETDQAPEDANSDEPASETTFAHTATDENSRGDYTYLSNPAFDGDPNAVFIVKMSSDQRSTEDAYDHNIGVWYDFVDRKRWAIFNQDRAAVPAGTTFRVILPSASKRFVHRAELINTVDNVTYVDDPMTNGEPDAIVSVTQNWNPGGGVGIYNDHPVGVLYDKDVNKWTVYNLDGAPMPKGTAFNIAVSEDEQPKR